MNVTAKVKIVVRERAGGCCELCGRHPGPDYSYHHRRPRGMGGSSAADTNQPQNLLFVCGSGTTGCHGLIEASRLDSYDFGWLVRQGHDPLDIPVVLAGARRRYLTADGGYDYREVA